MIETVERNGPPEAMSCPAFVCDACRKQVVKDGNIFWVTRPTSARTCQSSPLFVSHKYPCSRAVEAWIERAYPESDGWSCVLSEEISHFIDHLTNNLRHSFEDDPEGVYHRHVIVFPQEGPQRRLT